MLRKISSTALSRYILRQGPKLSKDKFIQLANIIGYNRYLNKLDKSIAHKYSDMSLQTITKWLQHYNNIPAKIPPVKTLRPLRRANMAQKQLAVPTSNQTIRKSIDTLHKIRSDLQRAYEENRRYQSELKPFNSRTDWYTNVVESRKQLQPTGPIISQLPQQPKKYAYGGKNFAQFDFEYSRGRPVFATAHPSATFPYVANAESSFSFDPENAVIFRFNRPKLKHEGLRPVSTPHTGIAQWVNRYKYKRHYGNKPWHSSHRWGKFTNANDYQIVFDNTSGSLQDVVDKVYKSYKNGGFRQLDWLHPKQTNKLFDLYSKLR